MNVIELIKIFILGIVEGITEWLPISSTGHMLLVDEFFTLTMRESFKEVFFVVIQLGAILAVVILFWKKLFPFRLEEKKPVVDMDIIKMWITVAIGCLPAAVLGFLFDDFLEEHFGNAFTISVMLIVYGIAFLWIENWNKKRTPAVTSLQQITPTTALLIGLFQALSMIPGTSRSGATIIGALLLGVSRTTAAEYSFFLAIPVMLGASALKLFKFGFDFLPGELLALTIGMVVALIVSLLSIRFLMNYVRKHDFKIFGWYRIVLGILVILLCIL